MKLRIIFSSVVFALLLVSTNGWAQTTLGAANKQYDLLAYAKAIPIYEDVLKGKLTEGEKLSARAKLAYCYRQIRDTQNAERIYRELAGGSNDLTGEYVQCHLYYAQALASNGKYKEAQTAYDKFSRMQEDDKRGKSFGKLYNDVSVLQKNTSKYRVDYLELNSGKAEFSPAYFKKGIVFVSGRNEGGAIKRTFAWNDTPFLDLYYLSDLSALGGEKTASLGGSEAKNKKSASKKYWLGSDEYTAPTSNDTKTLGFHPSTANGMVVGAQDASPIAVKEMGKVLNSKYHEGPVTFYKDGNRMIFTRNNFLNGKYKTSKDGINKLKLYSAEYGKDLKWSKVQELPLNSDDYSTGHPTLSNDDKYLYFASDRPGGMGGTDIYVAKAEGDKWSEPVNLGPAVNTKGNEMFPFVDEKGNLYFSSDGHPGLGDLDIYFVQMIEGTIPKKPFNLGAPINSNKDDFGIIADGERKSGFLSSNRRRGGVDDDIYRFEREGALYPCRELFVKVVDAETNEPLRNANVEAANKTTDGQTTQNMTDDNGMIKFCLNADNDFLLKASLDGYLNNNIGFSTKDLTDEAPTRLEIPLEREKKDSPQRVSKVMLKGMALAQKDMKPLDGVKIILKDECDGSSQEIVTTDDGAYAFEVDPGCFYSLEGLKDNFGTAGNRLKVLRDTTANLILFEKGDIIKVENIYYDYRKFTIRKDAGKELNKLVALMEKYPKMKLEFRSHTDSRGSTTSNKTLSANRAKSAVAYIFKKGIAKNRIVATGYGESILVNKCKDGVKCTEAQHQENRRTEIKILSL